MIEIEDYVDSSGRNPFRRWLRTLDASTAVRIQQGIYRLQLGNISALKSGGHGISELRLDFGPGYRVYCARYGDTLVVLLGGGTKKRQQADIEGAQHSWQDYKHRKKKKAPDHP